MKKTVEYLFERIASMLIGVCTLGIYNYVVRGVHKEMVEEDEDVKTIRLATFSEFKRAFDRVGWNEYTILHPDSLFTKDYKNKFHASIILFGNEGYLMTTYGLLRANWYKNRYIKRHFSSQNKPIIF